MVFKSKVDTWLLVLLFAVPLFVAAMAVAQRSVISWVTLALVLMTYACLVIPVRYTLLADSLQVRNGLVKRTIPYASIQGMTPTRNPVSSPALSLDRLEIRVAGAKSIIISPEDRDRFVAELQQGIAQAGSKRL